MSKAKINRQNHKPAYATINNLRWGKPSWMKDYEIYKEEIINNGCVPINLPKTRNFDLDDVNDCQ